MEDNLRKEEHPRFQRAKDAREQQGGDVIDDFSQMEDEAITRATEEYLRKHPQDDDQEAQSRSSKRKSGEFAGHHGKVQKTEGKQDARLGSEEQENREKRELQAEETTEGKGGKRIRLETRSEDDEHSDRIAQEYGISSLTFDRRGNGKQKEKEARNRMYDVTPITEGQTSQLLKVAHKLPDVNRFHDTEDHIDEVSTKIAWDD